MQASDLEVGETLVLLGVHVTLRQKRGLRECSLIEGRPQSAIIRQLLESYLRRQPAVSI